MREAIESRSGQVFAAEDFGPVFERQVRGDNDAVSFVRGADHVEQKFRTDFAGRHVTQFIKNEQVEFRKLSLQSQEYSFFAGFQQLCDQFRDPVEPNSSASTTGSDRQCNRQCNRDVCFSSSRIADQQDVLSLVDVLAEHQFGDQNLVERRLCLEVERVQRLVRGELRGFEATF